MAIHGGSEHIKNGRVGIGLNQRDDCNLPWIEKQSYFCGGCPMPLVQSRRPRADGMEDRNLGRAQISRPEMLGVAGSGWTLDVRQS